MSDIPKPMVLIILDGYGYREDNADNAINAAKRPNWDKWWGKYPHTLISGSGADVGLPEGQMGNSEVGHINLGAGRVVYQELTRIGKAIKTGEFEKNPVFEKAVDAAKTKTVHILGLLSPGGVHSHEDHLIAAVKMAAHRGAERVMVHAFLDGRDTPPQSAKASLEKMDAVAHELGVGRIASIVGRYYAMDRDNRWDRVEQAYDMLTQAKGEFTATTAVEGLEAAYGRDETDEFVKATVICGEGEFPVKIADGDTVIFMNFRADRARQLTHAFVDKDFDGFKRAVHPALAAFVTLTQYEKGLPVQVAYPPEQPKNTVGEIIAAHHLKQLRIAETEKYAHVTFFFNGGVEKPFEGEARILVPSPKVATYDLQPEMSAVELTDKLVEAINSKQFDAIICNYANADMVGHTGKFDATVKAIETLDKCLGRVVEALEKVGGEALITADHGNAEKMKDPKTGQPHTAHTSDPVPLLYIGRPGKVIVDNGVLSDVAPTMLTLMNIAPPSEMTGRAIFKVEHSES